MVNGAPTVSDNFDIEDKNVHENHPNAQDINEYLDIINEENELCEDKSNIKKTKIAKNKGFDESGENCDKKSKSKQNSENIFFCEICSKGFQKKNTMQIHIKSVHDNNRPFCSICFRSFSKQSDLLENSGLGVGHFFMKMLCTDRYFHANYIKKLKETELVCTNFNELSKYLI